jgi:ATP-dependent DNA helicase RecG
MRRRASPRPGPGAAKAIDMVTPLEPNQELTALAGLGPRTAELLREQGLASLLDLVWWFPRRSRALVCLQSPNEEHVGELVRLAGEVRMTRSAWLRGRRNMVTLELVAADGTPFRAAFFNQPWLKKAWQPGQQRVVEGVLLQDKGSFRLKSPRVLQPTAEDAGAVQLLYPELQGVSQTRLQKWIEDALARINWSLVVLPELPAGAADSPFEPEALFRAMHRPRDVAEHEAARRQFALHEAVQLFERVEEARQNRLGRRADPFPVDEVLDQRIRSRLPFSLTGDQESAVQELRRRLLGPSPMGVLLQGDVGTGKTAVAVATALCVLARGGQVAFLAPTELLAEQHHATVRRWLEASGVRVVLLTAGRPAAERAEAKGQLAQPGPVLVFGTHALFSERTAFHRLDLVIVDEQHRFGVQQRMALVHKGADPHVLVMTATPIPRTLTLTRFGDLDLLTLRERPPGHAPVLARSVAEMSRAEASIHRAVRRGGGVFVVCPEIGEDGQPDGAVATHAELSRTFSAELVHGRMPNEERQRRIAAFRAGECEVLVGTTVLEVGVDQPRATLMVVRAADRFGLATLHQLRGRVGRGRRRGLCIVVGPKTERTHALCRTTCGFELAETDLRLRGSGELLGTRQSGHAELRALDPLDDEELLLRARRAVSAAWTRRREQGKLGACES